jgi:tetratricopeptide (TPR) repeat protein
MNKSAQRNGTGNLDHARKLLEKAVNYAPRNYQARALLALGSIAEYQGDYKAESEFYRLALSTNHSDVFTAVETRRAIAIQAFITGNPTEAIQILEGVLPLASNHPYLRGQLLNHLAVYYHQVGRLHEAVRLSEFACASPLAIVYHEWGETRQEIRQDISERESAPRIFAVSQVQQETEEKKESGSHSAKLRAPLNPVVRCNLLSSSTRTGLATVGLIISRLQSCHQLRGPPSPFRK